MEKEKYQNDHDNEIRETCNALGIGEYATQCIDIFDEMCQILDGKNPKTIVCCVVYFVCQFYHITSVNESNIAQQCGPAADTIRKTYKTLMESNRIERLKAKLAQKK